MKKSDRFWDWVARRYDRQAHADEAHVKAVERFAKYRKADDIVLDYACGTGVVANKIAPDVKEVYAIDASARMIELGKQRARQLDAANVHFSRKTIFDEELGRESFDLLLAFNILHLVEDAKKIAQRALSRLLPLGCVPG